MLILSLIGLIGSCSRSTIVGLIFSILFCGYITILTYNKDIISYVILLFLGLVFILILIISVKIIFELMSAFRPGSTRLNIFIESVNTFIEYGNCFLGMGFKPRYDLINQPIGSHSTLFGVLMKTGIMGLTVYITFVIYSLHRVVLIIKKMKYYRNVFPVFISCVCISTAFMWMVVEDIDAPSLAAFSFFILLGFLYLPQNLLFTFNGAVHK